MGWGSLGLRDALRRKGFTLYADSIWVGENGETVTDSIVGDIEEGRVRYVLGDDGKHAPLTTDMVIKKILSGAAA